MNDEDIDYYQDGTPTCSICHGTLPFDKESELWEATRVLHVRIDFDGATVEEDDHDGDYCKSCWEKIRSFMKTMVK